MERIRDVAAKQSTAEGNAEYLDLLRQYARSLDYYREKAEESRRPRRLIFGRGAAMMEFSFRHHAHGVSQCSVPAPRPTFRTEGALPQSGTCA